MFVIAILFFGVPVAKSQDTISIVTYNLLFYDIVPQVRDTNFRKVLQYIQPDVLVVQEIRFQHSVDNFRDNVLNYYNPGLYSSAQYIHGPDWNVALFYKTGMFDVQHVIPIPTTLRNIMKYRLKHNNSGQIFDVFGLHLKAGNSANDRNRRNDEVNSLRNYTNFYEPNTNYIVCGDFNFYGDHEPAYQNLLLNNGTDVGHFYDHLSMPGIWNNYQYRNHHSQSTRTRSFGGGATGGCDDRFDFFLFSGTVMSQGGMMYIDGSSVPIGNDGNHYNDSINKRPNTSVPDSIADALHYGSDHLPVTSKYVLENSVSITNNNYTFASTSTISSVYPNPFNYRVNILVDIAKADDYTISVYDMNGREVAIISRQYFTPGSYSFFYDGNELSSGNYFIQLRNNSERVTRRIVLVK